jgi:hypothetical protein
MNWKKWAVYAVLVIVVLKFSAQIKAALANVPVINKVVG